MVSSRKPINDSFDISNIRIQRRVEDDVALRLGMSFSNKAQTIYAVRM